MQEPENPEHDFTSLNTRIENFIQRENVASISAAIISENEVIWENGFGRRDLNETDQARPETIYLLASISKLVTATAVMQLAEQGKIDLDADIGDYLPFPVRNPYHPDSIITPRHFLSHRSSMANPDFSEAPNFYEGFPAGKAPRLFPWIRNYITVGQPEYEPMIWKQHAPGEAIVSSNAGMALLGYLVEYVADVNFAEYCDTNIFEPLEMNDSGFRLGQVNQAKTATLYAANGGKVEPFSVRFYPAVMLRSSTRDLSRFMMAFMNNGAYKSVRILEENSVQEMLEVKFSDANLAFGSGLGLVWRSYRDGNWLGHTGGLAGVSASFDFHKSHKIGVIVLSNQSSVGAVYPGGEIYDLLHSEAQKFF